MYLTGRITKEITVQERTPREALSGYLCAERGVRIGGCVAIQVKRVPLLVPSASVSQALQPYYWTSRFLVAAAA